MSEAKGPIQEGFGLQPGSVRRSHAKGCTPHHILCHFKTVRDKVQPIHPAHMWGRELVTHLVNPYRIGNKHAKLQSVARSCPQAHRERRYLSGGGNQTRTAGTSSPTPTAPLLVFDSTAHHHGFPQGTVDSSLDAGWGQARDLWPSQSKESFGDRGHQRRLY